MKKTYECQFSNSGTRNDVRMRVINKFSEEEPGTGNSINASKYDYFVEQMKDGNRIILSRPANLKNGFDFLIRVENYIFSNNKDYPKHDDLLHDLVKKKNESPQNYDLLLNSIEKVFNCEEITPQQFDIHFTTGYSAELQLKVLKWFFIEQDIRYWNYSGRNMLMTSIRNI